MAKKEFDGKLKETLKTLTKFGVKNIDQLKAKLEAGALTEEGQKLIEGLKNLGIQSAEDVEAIIERSEALTSANQDQASTIDRQNIKIDELDARIQTLMDNIDQLDEQQRIELNKLKQKIDSLKGQKHYLASTVKTLEQKVGDLEFACGQFENDNRVLTQQVKALEARILTIQESSELLNKEQQAKLKRAKETIKSLKGQRRYLVETIKALRTDVENLEAAVLLVKAENDKLTKENVDLTHKLKKSKTVTKIASTATAILLLGNILLTILASKYGMSVKDLKTELSNSDITISDLLSQKEISDAKNDALVEIIENKDQKLMELLDGVITKFGLTESMVFADQSLEEGQAPEKVTLFGDEYDIKVSESGKKAYADGQDSLVTASYFADNDSRIAFIDGYANEYLPAQIDDMLTEADLLKKEIEELKKNLGTGNDAYYQGIITGLESRIAELEAELEAVKSDSQATIDALNAEIAERDNEIKELQGKLDDAERTRAEAEQQRDDALAEKDALQDIYDELLNKYEEAITSGKIDETTINALAQELARVKDELERKDGELKTAQDALDKANDAYAELEDKYNEEVSKREDAERSVVLLEQQLKDAEAKILVLEKALEDALAGTNSKEESPSNSNTNEGTSNTPVADENNPDSVQPEDNNNEHTNPGYENNGR